MCGLQRILSGEVPDEEGAKKSAMRPGRSIERVTGFRMLDPWIIEEILRREQKRRQRAERPVLEIPPSPHEPEVGEREEKREEDVERGVVILDYGL